MRLRFLTLFLFTARHCASSVRGLHQDLGISTHYRMDHNRRKPADETLGVMTNVASRRRHISGVLVACHLIGISNSGDISLPRSAQSAAMKAACRQASARQRHAAARGGNIGRRAKSGVSGSGRASSASSYGGKRGVHRGSMLLRNKAPAVLARHRVIGHHQNAAPHARLAARASSM